MCMKYEHMLNGRHDDKEWAQIADQQVASVSKADALLESLHLGPDVRKPERDRIWLALRMVID